MSKEFVMNYFAWHRMSRAFEAMRNGYPKGIVRDIGTILFDVVTMDRRGPMIMLSRGEGVSWYVSVDAIAGKDRTSFLTLISSYEIMLHRSQPGEH